MEKKQTNIELLIADIERYQRELLRSDSTICHYRRRWRQVQSFMQKSGLTVYDKTVEDSFLYSVLGDYDYSRLQNRDKMLVNYVRQLLTFQETGKISSGYKKRSLDEKYPLKGELGDFIKSYIERNVYEKRLSEATKVNYYHYLGQFNMFLVAKGIGKMEEVTPVDIHACMCQLYPANMAAKYCAVKHIRQFLTDMYRYGKTQSDLSLLIERVNYRQQSHLPSTLSIDETKRLLLSVDRASPKGKRDYAILLTVVQLGLRCSDIVNLCFEHINWEKSTITFPQQKTGKTVELPLLPDVGNAIIDYLKHGRQESKDKHVFLQALSPYNNMKSNDLANLMTPYLRRAGINCENRKHGPHVLRHSLAGRMLFNGAQLPVISETLGHAGSETTMVYLRIDASRLGECALDVPEVAPVFYQRQGGVYEQ